MCCSYLNILVNVFIVQKKREILFFYGKTSFFEFTYQNQINSDTRSHYLKGDRKRLMLLILICKCCIVNY